MMVALFVYGHGVETLSMADLHDPCISTLRSRESFTISTCLDQERVICGRGPGIKANTILRQAAEMWRRLTGDCKNMTLQSMFSMSLHLLQQHLPIVQHFLELSLASSPSLPLHITCS